MTTTGTWYPSTIFSNPSFAPMTQDITETLQERGKRYGPFTGHAQITQHMKEVIANSLRTRGRHLADDQREALDMICHKIGRILNGSPDYADNWIDIAGYAMLVANRLEEESATRINGVDS
jgi:hypothetical protein